MIADRNLEREREREREKGERVLLVMIADRNLDILDSGKFDALS